jgi:hypothetical protein
MILYLDTWALLKLYAQEDGSRQGATPPGHSCDASVPSADLKPPADLGIRGLAFDGNDACVLGPALEPGFELGELRLVSAGQDLDGAVAPISHPAGEAEAEGPLAGHGAEVDALDPS